MLKDTVKEAVFATRDCFVVNFDNAETRILEFHYIYNKNVFLSPSIDGYTEKPAPRTIVFCSVYPGYAMADASISEQEWRKKLTPEQFHVCREKGTEPPYTGKYTDCTTPGIYRCVCCGQALFSSDSKFHSGCGWPSFWEPLPDTLAQTQDLSHGMRRIEVTCRNCGAHLGHVFTDGPPPTGLRYCINSVALELKENV